VQRHLVYYVLGVPRQTRSKLSPSRLPINLQIKPVIAEGSVHPRSNGSQPSTASVYHACIHTVAKSRSLSLLSSAILSLSFDLPFPAVWSLRTITKRFLASYKAKTRPVQLFLLPIWSEKGRDFRRPPKVSNRWFSLISHQRPSKPPSLESSPLDLPESTIFWLEISPENSTTSNSDSAWATRATRGIFVILWEI